jgi:hypothetical protein
VYGMVFKVSNACTALPFCCHNSCWLVQSLFHLGVEASDSEISVARLMLRLMDQTERGVGCSCNPVGL